MGLGMRSGRLRQRVRLIIAGVITLTACNQPAASENGAMSKSMVQESDPEYLGRFRFDIPRFLELRSEAYVVRGIALRVVPSSGDPREANRVYEQLWSEHLENVRSQWDPNLDARSEILEATEYAPGARVVIYQSAYAVPGRLNAEMLVHRFGSILWLSANGRRSEREMNAWLGELHDSLQGWDRSMSASDAPGQFYARSIAVMARHEESVEYEGVQVTFKGSPRDGTRTGEPVEVEVVTGTTARPESILLLERSRAMGPLAEEFGITEEEIRAGKRTVAGLDGEELILRMLDDDNDEVIFVWEFGGEAGSVTRPRVKLQMSGSSTELRSLTALWDALLDSVHPVP